MSCLLEQGSHVKRSLHQSQGWKNSGFWQRPPFLVNIELFDFFYLFFLLLYDRIAHFSAMSLLPTEWQGLKLTFAEHLHHLLPRNAPLLDRGGHSPRQLLPPGSCTSCLAAAAQNQEALLPNQPLLHQPKVRNGAQQGLTKAMTFLTATTSARGRP